MIVPATRNNGFSANKPFLLEHLFEFCCGGNFFDMSVPDQKITAVAMGEKGIEGGRIRIITLVLRKNVNNSVRTGCNR